MAKKQAAPIADPKEELLNRLQETGAVFNRDELYQLFDVLAEQFGYYRDQRLPSPDELRSIETASLTVDGFEKFGMVVVRPRTTRDSLVTIPAMVDRLLGDNLNPGRAAINNANLIAIAQHAIVAPVGLVDRVLNSTDPNDLRFLFKFVEEYTDWLEARVQEAAEKKSGGTSGNSSVSTSDTDADSSPPTIAG